MKILLSVILATLFTSGVLGIPEVIDDVVSPNTTVETTVSSTEIPVTTIITTTTHESSTVTTEPPTTPTAEPSSNTTTVSSTTVTSTTEIPITTKAPNPTPPTPQECSWNITRDNVTCIRVELKALFVISVEGKKEYIALTQNATSDESDCHFSNDTQKLVLSEPNYYTLTMVFAKESGKVFVNSTSFSYTLPEDSGTEQGDKKLFAVKPGSSYKCKADQDVSLGNVTMKISEAQIQAFGEKDNTGFGAVEECDADDKVSDAVPIAVGCALAALIIIVLIAYLVGRRQSRQKGYQSV